MTKIKALLVGCSYDDQDCEMQAGKLDVKAMEIFIKDNFEWSATRVLWEDAPDHRQPTRDNILNGFQWLVNDIDWEKDHLFFYFAGHGGLDDDGVSHILTVDGKHITAARMRKELVDTLGSGQQLTALFQHCHSGNSLEMPYVCKKPRDLRNGNFSRTSFRKADGPLVMCFGASNVKLKAHHKGSHVSFVTKALIDKYEENISITDIFSELENADVRAKPEFSCSAEFVEDARFLDTW
ncbi:peptidase C14, caspase domain-containing protein [Mycena galopus ATCC 62051]|nr:peptidase C14, caspase domain-containing protein [Mycena galopus ATCC 62051]